MITNVRKITKLRERTLTVVKTTAVPIDIVDRILQQMENGGVSNRHCNTAIASNVNYYA